MKISHSKGLFGDIAVPGDKSVSHRSIMLGSIAEGVTRISGFLNGADCISTINCFRKMGVQIDTDGTDVTVSGAGLYGLEPPEEVLDCGNSGTTTRIISGLLSAQSFDTTVTGDDSICRRPMKRIMEPLSMMGASIESVNKNGCAPLFIHGKQLHGIDYISPVASAQVKSSVLMAGLYASSPTSVTEPYLSRNHTELMLRGFGADVSCLGTKATVYPGQTLHSRKVNVPGDISSAAYFLGAGLIVPDSAIVIRNVGINPTRAGIIQVFNDMGASIALSKIHTDTGELTADISVQTSPLHGIVIGGSVIPALIDELPLIAVAATQASGTTVIRDASELKVKESDRIALMTSGLKAMGADITATDDGMIINGPSRLHPACVETALDHRIAMSFSIAALLCEPGSSMEIPDSDCVRISYPGFFNDLASLER